MSGRSTVSADAEQRRLLGELAQSRDRGEADRARAILLTLSGWSGPRIAEAFGVAENTVRLWRMAFMREGVAALRTSPPRGPAPVKAARALEVAAEVLSVPVADRSRGAWIGSRFLNNLGFVKAVFGARIGIDRVVMSAICLPI